LTRWDQVGWWGVFAVPPTFGLLEILGATPIENRIQYGDAAHCLGFSVGFVPTALRARQLPSTGDFR
jgi:hypothetical protein